MKKIFFGFILLTVLLNFLISCKKEEDETIYVDGTNISISGDTTHLQYSWIDNYNSGDSSELVNTINYDTFPGWQTNGKVIYSILIDSLSQGDVISASAKAEFNGIGTVPGIWMPGSIILVDADSISQLPESGGIEISEPNGYNYTPNMGQFISTHFGSYKCQQNLGNKRVNFCLAPKTSSYLGTLNVLKDFGRLTVTVYRK